MLLLFINMYMKKLFIALLLVSVLFTTACNTRTSSSKNLDSTASTLHAINQDYVADHENVYYSLGGADPKTFRLLDQDYARDKNTIFYHGRRLSQVDPDSFVVQNEIARDKNSVFFDGMPMDGPDPLSFESLGAATSFYKDKNAVYMLMGQQQILHKVIGANPTTFRVPQDNGLPPDELHYSYEEVKVKN